MGRGRSGVVAIALGLPLVIALPLAVTTRYGTNLLILAAALSISTLGLTVLLGYAGQISLAQATFFGIGAYAVALGTSRWGIDWWLALPLGLGAATAAGIVLGMTTLKLGGHYLAMVTICFQIIFSQIATNWVAVTGGPDGISGIRRPRFFTPLDTVQQYAWFALGALFLVGVGVWFLRDSALGRSMRAVRENELAAEALGVDSLRVKVTAFALSAATAALGGALYASGFRYISPDTFSLDQSIEVLAMALAGGAQAVPGSIIGGFADLSGRLRRGDHPRHPLHARGPLGLGPPRCAAPGTAPAAPAGPAPAARRWPGRGRRDDPRAREPR